MQDEESSRQGRADVNMHAASFRGQALRVWERGSGYCWSVGRADTGEMVAEGEARSREDAMVRAAEAAGADWGNAKWRRAEDEGEE